MTENRLANNLWILLLGDVVVLAIVTLIGFSRHQEATQTIARKLTTFLPFLLAWLLVSLLSGAFDRGTITNPRQLWRPFWAMVLVAPFGALIRGLWLSTPIQAVFVIVVGGLCALGLLAWRTVYWLLFQRRQSIRG